MRYLKITLPVVMACTLSIGAQAQGKKIRVGAVKAPVEKNRPDYLFNDSHFHMTNYVQEGITAKFYVETIMGDKVGRSTLFGIPLQQQWSYRVTGDNAPTYYLETDAPLYYYSFTDAYIAMQYRTLTPVQQQRIDPMITGFNPTDMYAADHIKRVLLTFPGVFTGIGEFTIHKEFVSSKISGEVASLNDPALDRIFDFCKESGLLPIIHSDIDNPFPKPGKPNYLGQMKALVKRHPGTPMIWAHAGLGRVIKPIHEQVAMLDEMLADPAMRELYIDISWDEVAKYVVSSDSSLQRTAALLEKYPDRFLFGTDNVAPATQETDLKVYHMYDKLWAMLKPATSLAVRQGNYERLYDAARAKVRTWEAANVGKAVPVPAPTPSSGAPEH